MSLSTSIRGPVELRISALASEIFDHADLAATTMTPIHKARSAAFIVLAHAEIESAIELECRRTSTLLRNSAEPALAVLAWGFAMLNDNINVIRKKGKLPVEMLIDSYEKIVSSNHGIKEHNINLLLAPLGVDLDALKTDILVLDTFGEKRGDLAHKPLSLWGTTDLPSSHMTAGEQAGRSADQLIGVINAGHSRIHPATRRHRSLVYRCRNKTASILHFLADKLSAH